MARFLRLYGLFALLCIAQVVFWTQSRNILPDMTIVPDVPGKEAVKALSLGDEQFYFRLLALRIQNAGDTFGRFTPLKDYDYDKLSKWFSLLDMLDDESDYIPSLATYYYSQTQNTPDVRYVVDYLYEHAKDRPERKWWWLIQAMYLANHKLDDKELALEVGKPLPDAKGIPLWARHFPAFIYEQQGEVDQALYVMEHVLQEYEDEKLSREDFNFMKYFIQERLERGLPEGFEQLQPDETRQSGTPATRPQGPPRAVGELGRR